MGQRGTDVTESPRGRLAGVTLSCTIPGCLGSVSRWWAPDTGPCPWVVHSDSGICLPRDWMQTQTPLPNQQAGWGTPSGITSAWTRLATCLSCLWREDSPLQGRHAVRSRTSGLAATSELGEMLALTPREPHPQGFSCSSQYSLLHLFRTQGPGSLQEEFWRWSHTCARIFALWVPLTPLWGRNPEG